MRRVIKMLLRFDHGTCSEISKKIKPENIITKFRNKKENFKILKYPSTFGIFS